MRSKGIIYLFISLFVYYLFELGSHVHHGGLKLVMQLKMTLNSDPAFTPQSAEITIMYHNTCYMWF